MITIVTKKYCPYCVEAKRFLDALGKDYTEVEVSQNPKEYQKYQQISGMRTVPQIFVGTVSRESLIGGYDDMIAKFNAGRLLNS